MSDKTRKNIYIFNSVVREVKRLVNESEIEVTETAVYNMLLQKGLEALEKERTNGSDSKIASDKTKDESF